MNIKTAIVAASLVLAVTNAAYSTEGSYTGEDSCAQWITHHDRHDTVSEAEDLWMAGFADGANSLMTVLINLGAGRPPGEGMPPGVEEPLIHGDVRQSAKDICTKAPDISSGTPRGTQSNRCE